MKLRVQVCPGPGHIVLDGDPAPPPQRGIDHNFRPVSVVCDQTAGWIKMPLGVKVGLGPSDFVLDGDPAPLPKRGGAPQFSAQVYCGQMARWIKMALGMEVGLGPVHIVLDPDPAPLPKKGQSPQFSAHGPLWPNASMDQDAIWYIGRPQPRRHCVR